MPFRTRAFFSLFFAVILFPALSFCDFESELLKDLEKTHGGAKKKTTAKSPKKFAYASHKKTAYSKGSLRKPDKRWWFAGNIRSVYNGNIVWRGSASSKKIALTFDDGPFPYYTAMILDILKKYDVKATFFVVGQMVKIYPHLAKRIVEDGHEIANHSYTHPMLNGLSKKRAHAEIVNTHAIIKKITGQVPHFFRPPYGSYQKTAYSIAEQNGYTIVLWSSDCRDWSKPGVQHIVNKVMWKIKPGDIVLLHDGGGNRIQTVKATEIIIRQLIKDNYEMVTLSEMFGAKEPDSDEFYHPEEIQQARYTP